MALDIHAFIARETALTPVVYPATSTGADYSASVPGSTGTNDAGGVIIEVTGAFAGDSFDCIVQTSVEDAGTGNEFWVDTNSRVNGITATGQYQLHITDPIVAQCRLRIVRNAGAAAITFRINWMSDRALALL